MIMADLSSQNRNDGKDKTCKWLHMLDRGFLSTYSRDSLDISNKRKVKEIIGTTETCSIL
jgi:hypothetical protein